MKRTGIVLVVLFTLLAIGFAGCGTTSTKGDGPVAPPFTVDLGALQAVKSDAQGAQGEPTGGTVRNVDPLTKQYDDHLILLNLPASFDASAYSRITVKADYFDADGNLLKPNDDMVFVVLVYDPSGDLRGPSDGPGPNTPLKAFNVGGGQGNVSTDRGSRILLKRTPGAILFQNNSTNVKFIEVTAIIFHNGE